MKKLFSLSGVMVRNVIALVFGLLMPLFFSATPSFTLKVQERIAFIGRDARDINQAKPSHLRVEFLGFGDFRVLQQKFLERIFEKLDPAVKNGIQRLDFSNNGLPQLPKINDFKGLEELNLAGNCFTVAPDLSDLEGLKKLNLSRQSFVQFPNFKGFMALEELCIEGCPVEKTEAEDCLYTVPRVSLESLLHLMRLVRGSKEKITWKEYLELIDLVAVHFDDPMIKTLRAFYHPVSLQDGTLKSAVQFKQLLNFFGGDLPGVGTDEPVKKIDEEKMHWDRLQACIMRGGCDFDNVPLDILCEFSGHVKDYVWWLITEHVGPFGHKYVNVSLGALDGYQTAAAQVATFFDLERLQVRFNRQYFMTRAASGWLEDVAHTLGHEIAGHVRDIIVSNIVFKCIKDRVQGNDRSLIKDMLSLRNVDIKEQEYNADVQGFLSIQDRPKALALLRSAATSEKTVRSCNYTSFKLIRKNIEGLLIADNSNGLIA